MKKFILLYYRCLLLVVMISIVNIGLAQTSMPIPHLQKKGSATQLIVDGKPFLMLGGELGNSSSSNSSYMDSIWPTLEKLNLNTILAPVYWELIEPQEGKFDFSVVRDLILGARQRNIHLVLLWFGSWKNSMSCYAPEWVKKDYIRFPRARDINNKPVEIMSPFAKTNFDADKKAFAELMKFVKKIDGENHTVIMVQVENEIGMLPSARDHHPEAQKAFLSAVPEELMNYLKNNKKNLMPEFLSQWEKAGLKEKGNWQEVFGKDISTDEIFMAWYFAKYVEELTAAGKAEYPLPMFLNAALNRPGKLPGEYPSAGPLPHLIDVWKAASPSIDFFSPDIYFADFAKWCDLYDRGGNPLFLPEVRYEQSSGAGSNYETACGPKAFYAFGNHDAMGFSPFFIESTTGLVKEPITATYKILKQLTPIILDHQGTRSMRGFLFDKEHQVDTILLGAYRLVVKHDLTLGWSTQSKDEIWPITGGMIICTGEGEYFVAGEGIVITFPAGKDGKTVGINSIDEGSFENGVWKPVRRLNGDQSHQGRHLRIPKDEPGIQLLKLYKYE
jgi:beta-galactosidase GanA